MPWPRNCVGLALYCADLDDRFRTLLDEDRIIRLVGTEACENHFLFRRSYLPPLPQLVKRESAGRYFGRTTMLPDTDHSTAVRPDSLDHPAYSFVRDFRSRFEKKFLEQSYRLGISDVEHVPAGYYSCNEIRWDADIDLEGDASNELSFREVVLLEKQSENWIDLPISEVQSGHLLPYDLSKDDRTSQGITLAPTPQGARLLNLRVQFANRPTTSHPASFCLNNYDLNAFSMNTEEFKLKPNFKDDGTDYAEKLIEEDIGVFALTVRFPVETGLARLPYVEVYEYKGVEGRLHDGFTSAIQPYFRYSALRAHRCFASTAVPPPPTGYRISWYSLGGLDEIPSTQANPLLEFRAKTFASRMLEVRRFMIGNSEVITLRLSSRNW